jgi:uncharacterized 2Fe-2S/4Fe-4S cluster protein (DUF4445 family)
MKSFGVRFLPQQRFIEVAEGTTVAEAARLAEVSISNLCGGEGVCGKCRIRVSKGRANPGERDRAVLSTDEIDKGYVLACQAAIHDHLEVVVPPESQLENTQIMKDAFSELKDGLSLHPLVTKIFLKLPPPTIEDNIPDVERILRELRKTYGWHSFEFRLDCLQALSQMLRESDWEITATVSKVKTGYLVLNIAPHDTASRNLGIALDIGTTTVVGQLVDLLTGEVIAVEGSHNLQAKYGEDVISRMIYACNKPKGLTLVHEAIIKNINQIIEALAAKSGFAANEISVIVAAGNTTMCHFLLGLSPCSIRLDPYVPTADEFPQCTAADLGIHISPNGVLETIPAVASYVGGDIVAGVLSCGIPDHEAVGGLIDIGTNGEIALGNQDWLVCCSASAGPAFEGGGTKCGVRAITGAIEKVQIRDGQPAYETIGNASPVGICGSGLIDCIFELVSNHIIGFDGKFDRKCPGERLEMVDDIPQYVLAHADETATGGAIVVTESDIGNLIKSKAAVFAAIKSLVDYIGLEFAQIDTLCVAGGFGSFLNIPKAVAIGLLPDIPMERIRFVGNSSLDGARQCLLSEGALESCINISRSMTNIELSVHQPFTNEYIAALFLPHTDRRLFPSVRY